MLIGVKVVCKTAAIRHLIQDIPASHYSLAYKAINQPHSVAHVGRLVLPVHLNTVR